MTTHPNSPLHHDGDLGALSEQQPTVLPGYLTEKVSEQQIDPGVDQAMFELRSAATSQYGSMSHEGFDRAIAIIREAARAVAEAKLRAIQGWYPTSLMDRMSKSELGVILSSAPVAPAQWRCAKCDGADVPEHFRTCPDRRAADPMLIAELRDAQGDGSDWTEDLFKRAADALSAAPSEATTDETAWEYGIKADGDDEPWSDISDDVDWLLDGVSTFDGQIVRRRKPGPWLPVAEQGITDETGVER